MIRCAKERRSPLQPSFAQPSCVGKGISFARLSSVSGHLRDPRRCPIRGHGARSHPTGLGIGKGCFQTSGFRAKKRRNASFWWFSGAARRTGGGQPVTSLAAGSKLVHEQHSRLLLAVGCRPGSGQIVIESCSRERGRPRTAPARPPRRRPSPRRRRESFPGFPPRRALRA